MLAGSGHDRDRDTQSFPHNTRTTHLNSILAPYQSVVPAEMSNVAEKARFFLERSVPQLREWEEKEVFSKKRSDFEYRILAHGCQPTDFSQYAKWEQSLDALRLKRCIRLKLRGYLNSAHASQSRILQIYERGVERHRFARPLWIEYLDYMAKVKASKRWRKVMTQMLRLMPSDTALWVLAARRSAGHGDMATARSLFMRGCKFCADDSAVWIEYARCEMEWLQKMDEKKKKTGKKSQDVIKESQVDEEDELRLGHSDSEEEEDIDEDGRIARDPDALVSKPKKVFTAETKETLNNPALNGAIPIAIFDVSRKQAFFSPAVAESFFDMFSTFVTTVVAGPKILQNTLDAMRDAYPAAPETIYCYIREPSVDATNDKHALQAKLVGWVDAVLEVEDLEPGIAKVLEHMKLVVSK
ncbi:unnamed protein product [Parascedosporium putredinis]|uniref:U3 small nucleolar RNA-associated protein 6 N-terminal domain-containing protein n=1 Tax=Parascedosporium putredinis TaxID=1442378 RepID=A0A9P1MCB4_9PEZI|nr:unnamed protein product [Parascedosporium putredinis]CAI7996219.1 unnamed protein product [Parascedosporium putredinis]